MLLLWAILFLVIAIGLGAFALTGIAIAVSFLTKILLLISFVCFVIALVLIIIERIESREHQKELKNQKK